MRRNFRIAAIVGVVLVFARPAFAQSSNQIEFGVGYAFMSAETTTLSTKPLTTTLPLGIEGTIGVRVSQKATLVGTFSSSRSKQSSIPTGGLTGFHDPSAMGTVRFAVTDVMGGVKVSANDRGFFGQLQAGVSTASRTFTDVSSAGQSGVTIDQGIHAAFVVRPEIGFDVGSPSSRIGFRIEGGPEVVFSSNATTSHSTFHFRVGGLITFGG